MGGYLCIGGIVGAAGSSWWQGQRIVFGSLGVVVVLVVMCGIHDTSVGFRTSPAACG